MADQDEHVRRNRRFAAGVEDVEPMVQDGSSPYLDSTEQHLHELFITVANNIAEFFRAPGWTSFSKAAMASTSFYKTSCDAYRRSLDVGIARGRQVQCKELLSWVRSYGCPFIRKEDLENYLADRLEPGRPESMATVVRFAGSSPVKEQADTMSMFSEALTIPQDLNRFFQEACLRHAKRRSSHTFEDTMEAMARKRQRRS